MADWGAIKKAVNSNLDVPLNEGFIWDEKALSSSSLPQTGRGISVLKITGRGLLKHLSCNVNGRYKFDLELRIDGETIATYKYDIGTNSNYREGIVAITDDTTPISKIGVIGSSANYFVEAYNSGVSSRDTPVLCIPMSTGSRIVDMANANAGGGTYVYALHIDKPIRFNTSVEAYIRGVQNSETLGTYGARCIYKLLD